MILFVYVILAFGGPAQRRLTRVTFGTYEWAPALSFLSSLVLRLQIAAAIHLGVGGCEHEGYVGSISPYVELPLRLSSSTSISGEGSLRRHLPLMLIGF